MAIAAQAPIAFRFLAKQVLAHARTPAALAAWLPFAPDPARLPKQALRIGDHVALLGDTEIPQAPSRFMVLSQQAEALSLVAECPQGRWVVNLTEDPAAAGHALVLRLQFMPGPADGAAEWPTEAQLADRVAAAAARFEQSLAAFAPATIPHSPSLLAQLGLSRRAARRLYYAAVVVVAPIAANLYIFGTDPFSEPRRLDALARDGVKATATVYDMEHVTPRRGPRSTVVRFTYPATLMSGERKELWSSWETTSGPTGDGFVKHGRIAVLYDPKAPGVVAPVYAVDHRRGVESTFGSMVLVGLAALFLALLGDRELYVGRR